MPRRCEWAVGGDPLNVAYHDEEWGVPSHDDRHLFELLTLEGAQAGLSWATILRKREGYRSVFEQFDADRVARFNRRKIDGLLRDPSIVRNRLKIESTVNNARRMLEVQEEFGTFSSYIWGFVGGAAIVGRWRTLNGASSATRSGSRRLGSGSTSPTQACRARSRRLPRVRWVTRPTAAKRPVSATR
jgi:DNA-3-methyladenine glycosylase I